MSGKDRLPTSSENPNDQFLTPAHNHHTNVIDLSGEDSDDDDHTENGNGSSAIQEAIDIFRAQDVTRTKDLNKDGELSHAALMNKLADFEHQMYTANSGLILGGPPGQSTKLEKELEKLPGAVIDELPLNIAWPLDDEVLQIRLLGVCRKYDVAFIMRRLQSAKSRRHLDERLENACRMFQRATAPSLPPETTVHHVKLELAKFRKSFSTHQAEHYRRTKSLHIIQAQSVTAPVPSTDAGGAGTVSSTLSTDDASQKPSLPKFPTELPSLFSARERLTYFSDELTGDNLLHVLHDMTATEISTHLVACGGPPLPLAEIRQRRTEAEVGRNGDPMNPHVRLSKPLPDLAWSCACNTASDPALASDHKTLRAFYHILAAVYVYSACHPHSDLTTAFCKRVLPKIVSEGRPRLQAYMTSTLAQDFRGSPQAKADILSYALEAMIDHVDGVAQKAQDATASTLQLFDKRKKEEPEVAKRLVVVNQAGRITLEL